MTAPKKIKLPSKEFVKKIQQQRFGRQFDKNYKGDPGVSNDMPSMTVPDMNLTLKELLHNHTRGIQSDVHHYEAEYFEDEMPTITDLTDLDELKRQNDAKSKELQKKAKEELEAAESKRNAAKASTEKPKDGAIPKPIDTPKDQVLPDPKTTPVKQEK